LNNVQRQIFMFQTIRVFGPYAYGLPSFKRLSRLQKYFTGQRYSNLKYIKKVNYRNCTI